MSAPDRQHFLPVDQMECKRRRFAWGAFAIGAAVSTLATSLYWIVLLYTFYP